ncbi:hypothetical protein BD324DRAFT_184393 [Kockovaella imperatae]|uniref:Uncharacterized protein n=1 Tax=Kockovaella imperatae TaxID=4999 RepID=A0A1Y1U7D5_9TREE|nr:hypothetical protein BD324DRAFT_184393 [Kockovaella imperatae]ORX33941.1 hypothetical protein BD324DRAFT_184393 [Kockovaella imperatae]
MRSPTVAELIRLANDSERQDYLEGRWDVCQTLKDPFLGTTGASSRVDLSQATWAVDFLVEEAQEALRKQSIGLSRQLTTALKEKDYGEAARLSGWLATDLALDTGTDKRPSSSCEDNSDTGRGTATPTEASGPKNENEGDNNETTQNYPHKQYLITHPSFEPRSLFALDDPSVQRPDINRGEIVTELGGQWGKGFTSSGISMTSKGNGAESFLVSEGQPDEYWSIRPTSVNELDAGYTGDDRPPAPSYRPGEWVSGRNDDELTYVRVESDGTVGSRPDNHPLGPRTGESSSRLAPFAALGLGDLLPDTKRTAATTRSGRGDAFHSSRIPSKPNRSEYSR